MVCDVCHTREAVIFLEQVSVTGQKRKISLCMECAMERKIGANPDIWNGALKETFDSLVKELGNRRSTESSRLCPVCGTSLSKIKSSGKAGCPECYAIFKDDIVKILSRRGIKGTYGGTMPSRLSSIHSVLNDRVILQNKLNDAVAHEDYEKAAMYRDYLRALEKAPVAGDGDESESNGVDGVNSINGVNGEQ